MYYDIYLIFFTEENYRQESRYILWNPMALKRIDSTNSSRNVADTICRHLNIRYALRNENKPDDDK